MRIINQPTPRRKVFREKLLSLQIYRLLWNSKVPYVIDESPSLDQPSVIVEQL
jgi:hypothetical protein